MTLNQRGGAGASLPSALNWTPTPYHTIPNRSNVNIRAIHKSLVDSDLLTTAINKDIFIIPKTLITYNLIIPKIIAY